jgi:hypothetical protein
MECAATINIVESVRLIDSHTSGQAKELLENIVAIVSTVSRKKAQGTGD